jgi:hypothetical protein
MIFLASAISACLYRVGGASKDEIPFANSQYRDIGCPVIVFGYLLTLGVTWYLALVVGLAVCGLIRTYWDFITGDDNLWLHGAGIGLCMTPLCWDGVSWMGVLAYTAILSVTIGGLNTLCTRVTVPGAVWIEELFRGAVLIAAIPVIFWG